MKWFWKLGRFTFAFLLLGFVLNIFSNVGHENVHKTIAVYHGCDNYTIKYYPSGSFQCHNFMINITEQDFKDMYYLDVVNEIVTYNLGIVVLAILICGYVIGLIIYVR